MQTYFQGQGYFFILQRFCYKKTLFKVVYAVVLSQYVGAVLAATISILFLVVNHYLKKLNTLVSPHSKYTV